MTVGELEAALRTAGAVHQSASLLATGVAFTLRVRDTSEGPLAVPVAITGQGASLEAAALEALRKVSR